MFNLCIIYEELDGSLVLISLHRTYCVYPVTLAYNHHLRHNLQLYC